MTFRFDDVRDSLATQKTMAGQRLKDAKADANETLLFTQNLEYVHAEVLKMDLPEDKWRLFVPIKPGPSPADETHSYQERTEVGEAKLITNYADDLPNVSGTKSKTPKNIESYGASYSYSIQDMRACAQNGTKLDVELAETARTVIARRLEKASLLGEPSVGFEGLFKLSGVTETALPVATASMTPAQWVAAITAARARIFTDTNGVHGDGNRKLMLVLSSAEYASVTEVKDLGSGNYGSVADIILNKCPWLEGIEHSFRLNGIAAASKNRMALYARDPKVVYATLPVDFEQHTPQLRNLAIVTDCHSRFGGLVVRQLKAIQYLKTV